MSILNSKLLLLGLLLSFQVQAHEMQHGFILSFGDTFASHLVATGHHSRQVEVVGKLSIDDAEESEFYDSRKKGNSDNHAYFVLQAQQIDLPSLKTGQVLTGHIIESKIGQYEPKNVIVNMAKFTIEKVLLNIENPFFTEE